MADIFISYARKDRQKVVPLGKALKAQGWSVFWDRVIPGGKTWDEVIEEELEAAKCVVVVWSKNGVSSKWVRAEAEEGLNRNILVPVSIENLKPPLLFRPIQAVQLTDWDNISTHRQFVKLISDLESILGTSPLKKKEKERKLAEEQVKKKAEAEENEIIREAEQGVMRRGIEEEKHAETEKNTEQGPPQTDKKRRTRKIDQESAAVFTISKWSHTFLTGMGWAIGGIIGGFLDWQSMVGDNGILDYALTQSIISCLLVCGIFSVGLFLKVLPGFTSRQRYYVAISCAFIWSTVAIAVYRICTFYSLFEITAVGKMIIDCIIIGFVFMATGGLAAILLTQKIVSEVKMRRTFIFTLCLALGGVVCCTNIGMAHWILHSWRYGHVFMNSVSYPICWSLGAAAGGMICSVLVSLLYRDEIVMIE